jgi:hypothetical protein
MWPDYITRREDVLRMYDAPPSLADVYLHEIALGQEGPHLRLRFNLSKFPVRPPDIWVRNGFNTVQVTLGFWGLSAIELHGFALENRVSIKIERVSDIINFNVTGTTQISGRCVGIVVQKVSAYRRV